MKKSTYAFALGLLLGCVAGAIGYYLYQKPKYKKQILKAISWLDSRIQTQSKPTSKTQKPTYKSQKPKKFTRKLS